MSARNAHQVVVAGHTNAPPAEQHPAARPVEHATAKAASQPTSEAPLNLGERALQLAESIFDRASVVKYVHRDARAADQIEIDTDGTVEARTDCSGFISYIVHAIAPRHYKAVRSREPGWPYPQAKIWARFFNTLDTTQPTDGWLAVTNWRDLRPGDIVAWEEGNPNSSNTGHVTMVVSKPTSVQEVNGYKYIQIPVIDSSSVYHFAPEQLPPKAYQKHRNGLGMGGVRILLSDTGEPIGYWEGTYWGEGDEPVKGPTLSKMVRFGRMVPLEQDG